MTAAAYFSKMKKLGDELAAAGKVIEDDEMVTLILAGLDFDYNPLVQSVVTRPTPISVSELYSQMLAYDSRLELLQENHNNGYQSSANSTSRGRGSSRGRGGRGGRCGCGPANGGGRGNGGPKQQQGSTSTTKPLCQICGKPNHEVVQCWHRYDESYQRQQISKTAGSATTGYGVDTNWYVDSGATDHVTGELEKLTVRDKYHGHEQVHTASGSGMRISSIGHTVLHTPHKNLHL